MKSKQTIFIVILITGLFLSSCAAGIKLNTEYINPPGTNNETFTLILYGARNIWDSETVAILDIEGDGYEMTPYAKEFEYSVLTGLTGADAFKRAVRFISRHIDYWAYDTRRIFSEKGAVIGYELKPLYTAKTNPLRLSYQLEDKGRVMVYILSVPGFNTLFSPLGDD